MMRRPPVFAKPSLVLPTGYLRRCLHRITSALVALTLVTTSCPLAFGVARADTVRRVALVVGNAGYTDVPQLANPVNDASDVAEALRSIGFDVTLVLDADGDKFRGSLRAFAAKTRGANMALFYYAGHAMHFDQESYLMPVGVKLEDESQVRFDMISVEDDVLGKTLRDVPVKILLLDACRDNPIATRYEADEKTRSLGSVRGLSPLPEHQPVGQLIAYATSPNQVAVDGEGRNSPFSAALKKHIVEPGVDVRAMLDLVKADVKVATQERQVPDVHDQLTEKVFLNPGETDREVWFRIEKSDDPAAFNDFLSRFPRSDFASAARANLKSLQLEATVKKLEADQATKAADAAKAAQAAQEELQKQAAAVAAAAQQRKDAEAEADRQKKAREAAEAAVMAEVAAQKKAQQHQKELEEAARQDALRLEQASREAAQREAQRLQAAQEAADRVATDRREKVKAQALLDMAAREQAARIEAARQAQARLEAAKAEAARVAAAQAAADAQREAERQAEETVRQAARAKALAAQQEAERQAVRRAELERQEAERQAIAAAQREWQEAQRDEARRFQAAQAEAQRVLAQKEEAAKQLAAKKEADQLAAKKAEAARLEADRQKAAQDEAQRQQASKQTEQDKLNEAKQKEAEARKRQEDAARREQKIAAAKADAERRAAQRAREARQAVDQAQKARQRAQVVQLERRTANTYAGVARPARIQAAPVAPRVSAPAASESQGCMTCGF